MANIFCEECYNKPGKCDCQICPYCNANLIDIDDFGLTICKDCFNKNKKIREQYHKDCELEMMHYE